MFGFWQNSKIQPQISDVKSILDMGSDSFDHISRINISQEKKLVHY